MYKYVKFTEDVLSFNYGQVQRLGMFEVHCDELIRALAKRAEHITNKLLTRMCKDHQEENKAYVN